MGERLKQVDLPSKAEIEVEIGPPDSGQHSSNSLGNSSEQRSAGTMPVSSTKIHLDSNLSSSASTVDPADSKKILGGIERYPDNSSREFASNDRHHGGSTAEVGIEISPDKALTEDVR